MATSARSVVGDVARELLRLLAALPAAAGPVRVAEAGGGLACLIQVWPAGERIPVAPAERVRRVTLPPEPSPAASRERSRTRFRGQGHPLWNTDVVLQNVERAVAEANASGVPVIHVRHVAKGVAPFFNEGTPGADIHPRILAAAPKAPVVVKEFADSFEKTTLEATLTKLGITELLVCGMMTQNCVTHTAISKTAEKYTVTVLPDCCTTVSEILHLIALHALSPRVKIVPSSEAL